MAVEVLNLVVFNADTFGLELLLHALLGISPAAVHLLNLRKSSLELGRQIVELAL